MKTTYQSSKFPQVSHRTTRLTIEKLSARARTRLLELTAEHDPLGKMLDRARRRRRGCSGDDESASMESQKSGSPQPSSDGFGVSTTEQIRSMRDMRLPPAGQWLQRDYNGREILVRILERGFEFEGKRYRTLSAIAKVVTGAHWNGHLFFGLTRQRK